MNEKISAEITKRINEYIKFDVLLKMKDFQLWKVTNACQEVKQYAYINLLCAQINKRFKNDSATNQSIENLIRLTKLNDIVGFKVAYQKLTNYNFEAVAIKSLKEHYMHFMFDNEYGIYFQFKNYNFNSFIDFMQIRENNHRLFSEPKVGQRAVPDELDKGMGKNEQCTIVKRQAPPVPVKPAMKPVNWQAKNEQGAKSNLEMDDLKMTLNREIEQVVAKRNECNLYQDEFDSNGNFRTLDNGNKEYGNSQLASILNPVVEEFKQKYNIGNCKTLDEKPDDEFTAL
ncbi:hypothetical protein [Spiroplasma endosymbiont of Nephrotoma flavescens]|uniref:hypothetical protein n=1 Tax=Spiroplasma endosymbiont of Nephrotoma flavescens TaxID=3066302 RepID=UPI00313CB2CA